MSYTLLTYMPNYRAHKALIAAQYNDVKINVPPFTLHKDNTTEAFLAKNPLGKVPVLETPHGPIFESNAIARYVARLRQDSDLYGTSFLESGQVDQWVDFSANELEPIRCVWLYPIFGIMQFDQETYEAAKQDMQKTLEVLERHLTTRTYLVGHQITLADIVVATALADCYRMVFDEDFRAPFVNVNRWFTTCVNQPQFNAVLGDVEFATEEQKAGAGAPAAKGGKKDKAPKEKKEKAPAAPKEKKEKAKPKEAEAEPAEAEADAEAAPPASSANLDLLEAMEKMEKKKNPLDDLPPSPMILDTVKKTFFLKRPNFAEFFSEFWPQFDAAGYSFWTSHYNYNADNTVYFMTCNLVGGWLQRLDELRKYAFGSVLVSGVNDETAPFNVSAAWMFRGTEIPAEMRECPDTEYYTFKRVDVSTEEGRKVVEAFFYHDDVESLAVLDRRYFK